MANNKIEDIFDEVDKASSPKTVTRDTVSQKINKPPVQPTPITPKASLPLTGKSKTPFVVMLIFVFLVLAGIIYLVITGTFIDTVEKGATTVVNTVTDAVDEVVDNTEDSESDASDPNTVVDIDNLNTGPLDSDNDGLTDEEENTYGTSNLSNDTDGDGLFDREEVKVYNTDPLKIDTDGDGQSDGVEVKNGYNPNGSGLLLDLQVAIDNL